MKNTLLSLSIFLIIIAVISSINLALFYQQWNLMLLCIEFIKSLALFSVAYIGFRLIKRLCKQNLKTACVDSNKKHFMLKIFLYCIAVCICAIVTAILIKHPSVSFAFDVFLIEVIILVLSLSLWILFYMLGDYKKTFWLFNYAISACISALILNFVIANYLGGDSGGFLRELNSEVGIYEYDYFRGYFFSLWLCSVLGLAPPFILLNTSFMAIIYMLSHYAKILSQRSKNG